MNEMNVLNLNGEQYEIADKKARAVTDNAGALFAPAIPVTMTGTAVSTDMVSPIEHEVECRISGVPDLSAVTVSRYGKNLFNNVDDFAGSASYEWAKNKLKVSGTSISYVNKKILLSPDTDYVFSFESIRTKESGGGAYISVNGKNVYSNPSVPNLDFHYHTKPTDSYCYIYFYGSGSSSAAGTSEFTNIQVEVGTKRTGYADYIEPINFTPTPSGEVKGMESVSPDMTILTDNPGATIEATYNADTKKYIDNKITEALKPVTQAVISTGGNV